MLLERMKPGFFDYLKFEDNVIKLWRIAYGVSLDIVCKLCVVKKMLVGRNEAVATDLITKRRSYEKPTKHHWQLSVIAYELPSAALLH